MNMSRFVLHAFVAVTALSVFPAAIVRAEPADLLRSIRFHFEEESQLIGSPNFPGVKTDFSWGEVEMDESVARILSHSLYRSDPKDPNAYYVTTAEWFSVDEHTVLTCQKDVEIKVAQIPQSLQEAQAIYEKHAPDFYIRHYFNNYEHSAREHMLRGYTILGMTPDGPIWRVGQQTSDPDGDRTVFTYTTPDGNTYRFAFDPQRRLFTKCSVVGVSSQFGPWLLDTELIDEKSDYRLATKIRRNPSSSTEEVTTITRVLRDVEFDRAEPIRMAFPPKEGDKINSVDDPQIKFEWREGRIAKVVDPSIAKDMEGVRFTKSRRWLVILNVAAVAVVLAVVYWKWRRSRSGVLLLLLCLLPAETVQANSAAYCGVHSLYGAARALGVDVELDQLVAPEYISSLRGSTADDLVRAAQSLGLEATAVSGLGVSSLRAAEHPLILHTAPLGAHAVYQHWVLFLGFDENDRARVVDGPGGIALCDTEELLARWDGVAVGIRPPDSGSTRYLSIELAGLCSLLVYGGMFSLVVRSRVLASLATRRWWQSSTAIHLAAVLAVSSAVGYATEGQGYRKAVRSIEASLGLRDLPKVSVSELRERIEKGAVLVDCRYEYDYQYDHIPGAINVPVDIGLGDLMRVLSNIDRSADVIVYCQSAKCGFSAFSATMLAGTGFTNVTVFDGGFETWKSYHDAEEEGQTDTSMVRGGAAAD